MDNIEMVRIENKAAMRIPVLRFPDGRKVELGPGDVVNDPANIKLELEKWFVEWTKLSAVEL